MDKPLDILAKLGKTTDLSTRSDGVYVFKSNSEDEQILQEIQVEDVPFLRSYYAVTVHDGIQHPTLLKVIVNEYRIYDYYPNGRTRRVVILYSFWDKNSILKNVHINEHPFENKIQNPMPIWGRSSHQPGETHTKITDLSHPYWLDKILHD